MITVKNWLRLVPITNSPTTPLKDHPTRRPASVAELDDQAAKDNQSETAPSGSRDGFPERESSEKDAESGKNPHINTEQPREVPFDGINHQPIASQRRASKQDPNCTSASQATPDCGVAANFKERCDNKNEQGRGLHAAVARAGCRCVTSSSTLTNCSL